MSIDRQSAHRRALPALVLGGLLLFGCGRPLDRPLQGAPPVRGEVASDLSNAPPPTLAPPELTSVPSPIVIVLASPSASPTAEGRPPIISALLPAPDALVPSGAVNIGARVSGSVDLGEVTLTVDGATVQPRITMQDSRVWLVAYTGNLEVGRHEARLNARDRDGRAGGYRWQFEVGARQPSPAPAPKPAPTQPAQAAPKPRPTAQPAPTR